jgi:hypothetical protein
MINQKGIFVQTTQHGPVDLELIIKSKCLGKHPKPLHFQPPKFKDIPLSFSSYVCEGYPDTYSKREGVIFEPSELVIYACPMDSFHLVRGGNWLPGYEQFIFESVEAMLVKYPSSNDFKLAFQEYFRTLMPQDVYPDIGKGYDKQFAESHYYGDYCLKESWNPGCNEITFRKPTPIKNCRLFSSFEELRRFINPEKPLELSLTA